LLKVKGSGGLAKSDGGLAKSGGRLIFFLCSLYLNERGGLKLRNASYFEKLSTRY
jgi:hypothetical protein